MDYEIDLRRELENAEAECARLREENTRLREQLLIHEETHSFSHSSEKPAHNSSREGDEFLIGDPISVRKIKYVLFQILPRVAGERDVVEVEHQ